MDLVSPGYFWTLGIALRDGSELAQLAWTDGPAVGTGSTLVVAGNLAVAGIPLLRAVLAPAAVPARRAA